MARKMALRPATLWLALLVAATTATAIPASTHAQPGKRSHMLVDWVLKTTWSSSAAAASSVRTLSEGEEGPEGYGYAPLEFKPACVQQFATCPGQDSDYWDPLQQDFWADVTCCEEEGDKHQYYPKEDKLSILPSQPENTPPIPKGRCYFSTPGGSSFPSFDRTPAADMDPNYSQSDKPCLEGFFSAKCMFSGDAEYCDPTLCADMWATAEGAIWSLVVASRTKPSYLPKTTDCPWNSRNDRSAGAGAANTTGRSPAPTRQRRQPAAARMPVLERIQAMRRAGGRGSSMREGGEAYDDYLWVGLAYLLSAPLDVSSRHTRLPHKDGWLETVIPVLDVCLQDDYSWNCYFVNGGEVCGCYSTTSEPPYLPIGWVKVPASDVPEEVPIVDADRSMTLKFYKPGPGSSYTT